MEKIFTAEGFKIICCAFIIVFRALYAAAIYFKCEYNSKKMRNFLTFLSIPFPIITGIVCVAKYKRSSRDNLMVIIALVFSVISVSVLSYAYTYSTGEKYYDKDGTIHIYASDGVFTDVKGNRYSFDFDKTGYDYLYINGTDERLNADWCYLDSNGYIYYDDDMSITAYDENRCIDEDGLLYYPAKYTVFNKDGTIKYSYNSGNFSYDRLGKAYTYDYVPYYDSKGDKYYYSFDSSTQKGTYTNIFTKETFENEYCFVDEYGYFVYDKEHSFVERDREDDSRTYIDENGQTYFLASSVFWNESGDLFN